MMMVMMMMMMIRMTGSCGKGMLVGDSPVAGAAAAY